MNTVEDRLRAATRAAANTVTPQSAPPLHLPSHPPGRLTVRLNRPDRTPRRRWNRIVIPLGAAVAVAAVVASSVYLGQQRSADSRAAAAALAQLPPYYLTTGQVASARHAWVAGTATGKPVATVPVPRGQFVAYIAASGHGTFAMATVPRAEEDFAGSFPGQHLQLFLIRFHPGSRSVSELPLTRLDHALAGIPEIDGIALSPDGGKLAVALSTRSELAHPANALGVRPKIMVADLRTGVNRTWSWALDKHPLAQTANYFLGHGVMSWGPDNQTVWFGYDVAGTVQVRRLDTAAAGTNLASDSKLAVSWAHGVPPDPAHQKQIQGYYQVAASYDPVISPDGSTVVIPRLAEYLGKLPPGWWRHPVFGKSAWSRLGFAEFSAHTGQPLTTVGEWKLKPGAGLATRPEVLWAGPQARTLIVLTRAPGAQPSYVISGEDAPEPDGPIKINAKFREVIAVLHDGQLTPLPTPVGGLGTLDDSNNAVSPVW